MLHSAPSFLAERGCAADHAGAGQDAAGRGGRRDARAAGGGAVLLADQPPAGRDAARRHQGHGPHLHAHPARRLRRNRSLQLPRHDPSVDVPHRPRHWQHLCYEGVYKNARLIV